MIQLLPRNIVVSYRGARNKYYACQIRRVTSYIIESTGQVVKKGSVPLPEYYGYYNHLVHGRKGTLIFRSGDHVVQVISSVSPPYKLLPRLEEILRAHSPVVSRRNQT